MGKIKCLLSAKMKRLFQEKQPIIAANRDRPGIVTVDPQPLLKS